jgi:hypothetical protein
MKDKIKTMLAIVMKELPPLPRNLIKSFIPIFNSHIDEMTEEEIKSHISKARKILDYLEEDNTDT